MSSENTIVLVITTVQTESDANLLAAALVERSLAACVQIDGPITSHYRWDGTLEQAKEMRLMIKTSAAVWPRLKQALPGMHPYDEPEIVMLPIDDSSEGYRTWVLNSVA